LTMRAIPERLRDVSRIGAIQIDITFTFNFYDVLSPKLSDSSVEGLI